MVIFEIPADRFEVFVFFFARAFVGILEEEVFQFGAALGGVAEGRELFYLVFEQGAWGNGDGLVVSVGLQIADDEGRATTIVL